MKVFDVLLQTARNVEALLESAATDDGTKTTLIDSMLTDADYRNDDFNDGSLFWKTSHAPVQLYFSQTLGGVAPWQTKSLQVTPDGGEGQGHSLDEGYENLVSSFIGAVTFSQLGITTLETGTYYIYIPAWKVNNGAENPSALYANIKTTRTGDPVNTSPVLATSGQVPIGNVRATAILSITIDTPIAVQPDDTLYITLISATPTAPFPTTYVAYGSTTNARFITAHPRSTVFLPLILRTTDFVGATGVITFAADASQDFDRFTTATDQYGLMANRYPLRLLYSKLNQALQDITDYYTIDTILDVSTLTNGEIAWAAVGTGLPNDTRVYKIFGGAASAPYGWSLITKWTNENGRLTVPSAGSYSKLLIQIFTQHPNVAAAQDAISDQFTLKWLALQTAVNLVRFRLMQTGADAQPLTTLLNDLLRRELEARREMRTYRPMPVSYNAAPAWPEE